MRTHLALGLFSLILMCATTAHGEDDSAARAEAETLVENGIRFARSGDFNGAIDQFEAALKLYPSAEIMHSLARAHEEAGHLSKAHSWFEKALSTTPNYLYAEDARERIYAIESRLRKTHALLHIRSTPAQARVSISAGEHKARHLVTPVSWWVPAGAVRLSGERSGFEPRDQDVTVQAGEVRTVELVLTPIQAKGFVTVTASEVGAVVKVDGQKVGTIPLGTLTLTEGTHIIEVQGADGSTMTRTVTIIANEAAP
ncbi:MAG: PEGA domain-containing protein, partial [Myxococcota bacterium]|nr:PEGA domain-containing protein [Myxococcota bacterium]